MIAEALLVDETPRGLIHSYFYPIALVQQFRPCSWAELHSFMLESERFREIRHERNDWLAEHHIKCLMRYETHDENPDIAPRVYRLYTEFSKRADAEAYRIQWTDGQTG